MCSGSSIQPVFVSYKLTSFFNDNFRFESKPMII
jgi:hypothetical protein